jgi:hypothetical protein
MCQLVSMKSWMYNVFSQCTRQCPFVTALSFQEQSILTGSLMWRCRQLHPTLHDQSLRGDQGYMIAAY